MVDYQFVKQKIYPRVHTNELKFHLAADSTSLKNTAAIQVLHQDEGLGDPNSIYTNPESSSFAEYQGTNCFPDSRVNYARLSMEFKLSLGAVETDKVRVMKIAVIPYMLSFLENYTAKDEVSADEVEDVLEMQHETTDRQGYPLYNGTKLDGNNKELGSAHPGLTTNTLIEGITLDINKLYDCLQYYTIGGKVRKSIGKIKWLYVSRDKILRVNVRARSKSKRMNPYTAFGAIVHLPLESESNSLQMNGELTNINHLNVTAKYRYNEWNPNFNFMR